MFDSYYLKQLLIYYNTFFKLFCLRVKQTITLILIIINVVPSHYNVILLSTLFTFTVLSTPFRNF